MMNEKTNKEQPPTEEKKNTSKNLTDKQKIVILQNQVESIFNLLFEMGTKQDDLAEMVSKLNQYREGGRVYGKLYDEEGGVFEITSESIDPRRAWDNMIDLIFEQNKNGFSNAPFAMKPNPTEGKESNDNLTKSVTSAQKKTKIDAILVQSIAVKLDQRNQRYLRVYGGYGNLDYINNGLPAFDKAIPKEFEQSFETMAVDARVKPPEFMEVAILYPGNNKVKYFRARKDKEPTGEESQERPEIDE